jgi:hypothetical protein
MKPIKRVTPWILLSGLLGSIGVWGVACSQRIEAAPRPITPRGDLTAEERSNIDVFEKWKGSVVYISTSQRGGFLHAQCHVCAARHRLGFHLG